jgi:uncharacterized membrane protein YraQ (UPF0718 family)
MSIWWIQFTQLTWSIITESATWILISLFFAGLIHEFLPTSNLKRLLNRDGYKAMGGAVAMGGLLPICSCGVIPIAVSLYKAGIRIGPVMAFTAATPIINPAAVILSFALLGPEITFAYILLGLILPIIVGTMSERFGTKTSAVNTTEQVTTESCCTSNENSCAQQSTKPFMNRIFAGLNWGFLSLGPTIGFYLLIGILLAGVLTTALPPEWIEEYLGANSTTGLLAAGLLGAVIYVCAVAHIPLVATLLASGAGPGAAIVFLVTGTATNLPELFALYKTIGKRTVIIYTITLILSSFIAGILVNIWLGSTFVPVFDPLASLDMVEKGEALWLTPAGYVNTIAAWLVISLAIWGSWLHIKKYLPSNKTSSCCETE